MDLPEECFVPTTAEQLAYNMQLIKYTLAQAHVDGRPVVTLFADGAWCADVNARFVMSQLNRNETQATADAIEKFMAGIENNRGYVDAQNNRVGG